MFLLKILAPMSLLVLISSSRARADDVKLKSGKVITNVNLVKETRSFYRFRKLNGDTIRIKKSLVLEVIRRPTAWDEFKQRRRSIKSKDAEGYFQLARWARQQGLAKDWRSVAKLALKADRNHLGANKLLGRVQINGRWFSKHEADRLQKQALEKSYKLRHWKKLGGRWLSGAEYSRTKRKWRQYEGRWLPPKLYAKVTKQKLHFFEGRWVDDQGLKKARDNYRFFEGRWLPLEDLDDIHKEVDSPWILDYGAFRVYSNVRHKDLLKIVALAQESYKSLTSLFGEEANTYDKRGPLILFVGRGLKTYKVFCDKEANNSREVAHSSCFGSFYSSTAEPGGAVVTYDYSDHYLRYWLAYGLAQAYLARFVDEERLGSNLSLALGGFVAGMHNGRYAPSMEFFRLYINRKKFQEQRGSQLIEGIVMTPAGNPELGLAWGGFFLHYLELKNPQAFRRFLRDYLGGQGGLESLIQTCLGSKKDQEIDQDFDAFLRHFIGTYKPWKP